MIEIKLRSGHIALIDDCDAGLLRFSWHARPGRNGRVYVARTKTRRDTDPFESYLHRLIMQPGPGMVVDHINNDPLDNRRANLRVCTYSENAVNVAGRREPGLVGVKRKKKNFQASVECRGTRYTVYGIPTEYEAALAADALARQFKGEFAHLNFPEITDYQLTRPLYTYRYRTSVKDAVDKPSNDARVLS